MKVGLEFPPGVVADDTVFSTPVWRYCDRVRFWRGKPQLDAGFERLTFNVLPGVCRSMHAWTDLSARVNVAFGQHNGLHVWQNGDFADITPASGFTPGSIDGTGSSGYGTGAYGEGDYGEPSSADYFPGTWSFGTRDDGKLYACFRGQKIYAWDGDTANNAATLVNSPANVNFMLCAPTRQVVALGCTDTGGNFNPSCIRFSDISTPTTWAISTTDTSQQVYIDGGGRIVGGRVIGDYIVVWTDAAVYLGAFNGAWNFERVGSGGLVGPNAVAVLGQSAFWIGPDLQFYTMPLGGSVSVVPSPVRGEVLENAAASQNAKIVAGTTSQYGEVVWFYADARDGNEVSRFVRVNVLEGAWSLGRLARTAYLDAGPADAPIGVTFGGVIYWHERGNSADGGVLSGSIESGALYLGDADRWYMAREFWPDIEGQIGPVGLTIYTRAYPQGNETEHGPYLMSAGKPYQSIRVSGRIARFKLSWSSAPAAGRIGRPTFDFVSTSER